MTANPARKKTALRGQLAVIGGVLAVAFLVAPFSCEGGLEIFELTVLGALVAAPIGTVLIAAPAEPQGRLAWGALGLGTALAAGIAGLLLAPFQILCRLF